MGGKQIKFVNNKPLVIFIGLLISSIKKPTSSLLQLKYNYKANTEIYPFFLVFLFYKVHSLNLTYLLKMKKNLKI